MKIGEKEPNAENGKNATNFSQTINDAIWIARGAVVHFFHVKNDVGFLRRVLIAIHIV